jgi:hypothetical protein
MQREALRQLPPPTLPEHRSSTRSVARVCAAVMLSVKQRESAVKIVQRHWPDDEAASYIARAAVSPGLDLITIGIQSNSRWTIPACPRSTECGHKIVRTGDPPRLRRGLPIRDPIPDSSSCPDLHRRGGPIPNGSIDAHYLDSGTDQKDPHWVRSDRRVGVVVSRKCGRHYWEHPCGFCGAVPRQVRL